MAEIALFRWGGGLVARLGAARLTAIAACACLVRWSHEQAMHAQHHKNVTVTIASARYRITLDIVPDEDDPHAMLAAANTFGDVLARVRVRADFRLTVGSATAWIEDDFRRPG